MRTKHGLKNVTVYAEKTNHKRGCNIYMDFSGKREFLMYHRHNGLLYLVLKDGIKLGELERLNCRTACGPGRGRKNTRKRQTSLEAAVKHLRRVIDEFMAEYAEYGAA